MHDARELEQGASSLWVSIQMDPQSQWTQKWNRFQFFHEQCKQLDQMLEEGKTKGSPWTHSAIMWHHVLVMCAILRRFIRSPGVSGLSPVSTSNIRTFVFSFSSTGSKLLTWPLRWYVDLHVCTSEQNETKRFSGAEQPVPWLSSVQTTLFGTM